MRTQDIITTRKIEVEATTNTGTAFELNAEALQHIMSVLTNLYSEAQTAVFREYLSNALDSHKEANQTKPVKITVPVPYSADNILTIQDFGVGMSLDEINKIYRQYGSSTKRDDNKQIGGFGLGGKSALALTDTFYAVSIKDGEKVEFTVEKKADGQPYLIVDNVTETTEDSGFTVHIPYPESNILDANKVTFMLSGLPDNTVEAMIGNTEIELVSVYNSEYFNTLTNFNNEPIGWYRKIENQNNNYYASAPTHPSRENTGVQVNIGGVVYRLYQSSIADKKLSDFIEKFEKASVNVMVNIPVGSVRFTPSREGLIYDDRTVQTLTTLFNQFNEAFLADINLRLNTEANTHKEALGFYETWGESGLSKVWRGEDIVTSVALDREKDDFLIIAEHGRPIKAASVRQLPKANAPKFFFNEDYGNTAVVYVPANDKPKSDDYYLSVVRKNFRKIHSFWGALRYIKIVPQHVALNPWFAHFSNNTKMTFDAFIEKYEKLHAQELEARRAERKRQRELLGDDAPVTQTQVADYKYQIVDFQEDGEGLKTTKVKNDDPILERSNVYFLTEKGRYVSNTLYSNMDVYRSVKHSNEDFSKLMFKNYYGEEDTVIFFLSSRQQVDVFKRLHPTAKNLSAEILNEATNEYKKLFSETEILWGHVLPYADHRVRFSMDEFLKHYVALKNKTGVVVEKFENMLSPDGEIYNIFRVEPPKLYKYESLVPQNTRIGVFEDELKKFSSFSKNVSFFSHAMSHPSWKEHTDYLTQLIKEL